MPKAQKPQQVKNKQQIKAEMEAIAKQQAKNERIRSLAKRLFPTITGLKTVYDAQTAFNAAAGHIKYGLIKEEAKLQVANLTFELGKGKSDVDYAVHTILELLAADSAKEAMETLELMGSALSSFMEARAMKEPMSSVKQEDFIG